MNLRRRKTAKLEPAWSRNLCEIWQEQQDVCSRAPQGHRNEKRVMRITHPEWDIHTSARAAWSCRFVGRTAAFVGETAYVFMCWDIHNTAGWGSQSRLKSAPNKTLIDIPKVRFDKGKDTFSCSRFSQPCIPGTIQHPLRYMPTSSRAEVGAVLLPTKQPLELGCCPRALGSAHSRLALTVPTAWSRSASLARNSSVRAAVAFSPSSKEKPSLSPAAGHWPHCRHKHRSHFESLNSETYLG